MHIALLPILLVAIASGSAYGQAATSNCPTIKVIGPPGITKLGEAMEFVAKINTNGPKVTYQWEVNKGTIAEGQGTAKIKIMSSDPGAIITATVKIYGLPNGCDNIASETGVVDPLIGCSMPSNEWGDLKPNEIRAHMDAFFAELSNNPDNLGVALLAVTENETLDSTNRRLQLLVKHAKFRKFDLERLVFKMERSELIRTSVWRVPPGAEMPCPQCVEHRGTHFK